MIVFDCFSLCIERIYLWHGAQQQSKKKKERTIISIWNCTLHDFVFICNHFSSFIVHILNRKLWFYGRRPKKNSLEYVRRTYSMWIDEKLAHKLIGKFMLFIFFIINKTNEADGKCLMVHSLYKYLDGSLKT